MKRKTEWRVELGDCIDGMRAMPDDSVDSIVCDPPYGIGFMAAEWDASVPGAEWAAECLRVLKPGGHLIAFAATRTIHRLAVTIEDAGFEIRDTLHWCFWNSMPKSHPVSVYVDRILTEGKARDVKRKGIGNLNGRFGDASLNFESQAKQHSVKTDEAKRFAGWGTGLKTAIEPAVLARKPVQGTVAQNAIKYGTGAINIDACRFAEGDPAWVGPNGSVGSYPNGPQGNSFSVNMAPDGSRGQPWHPPDGGRWPANLYYCKKPSRKERERGCDGLPVAERHDVSNRDPDSAGVDHPRSGVRRKGEFRNVHPTVKPVRLMRWLARLVTPSGGLVLDPFAGSGTAGIAAVLEGFDYIGFELKPEFHAIANARIDHASILSGEWRDTEPGPPPKTRVRPRRKRFGR